MNKLLSIIAVLVLAAGSALATDTYYAPTAVGSANGSSCANALALPATLTTTGGNTAHICGGTYTGASGATSFLTIGNSGSAGNLITVLADQGAVNFTSTNWAGGVINLAGHGYITINGVSTGNWTIQSTLNGTSGAACTGGACSHQSDFGECVNNGATFGGSNVTIEYINCQQLYHIASPADNGGEDTYAFDLYGITNLVIANNTCNYVKWCVRAPYLIGQTYTSPTLTAHNNTWTNMDHGYLIGANDSSGTVTMGKIVIHNDSYGSMTAWDNTADGNHHDWIHMTSNGANGIFTDVEIYDNVGIGDVGGNANAGIYLAQDSGSLTGAVINNVFHNTSTTHCWANGYILENVNAQPVLIANNTFVGNNSGTCTNNGESLNGDNGIIYDSSSNATIDNNLLIDMPNDVFYSEGTVGIAGMDYNDEYLGSYWTWSGKGGTGVFATWQGFCACDAHSILTNPNVNAGSTPPYQLTNSSSPAYRTGTNLNAAWGSTYPELLTDAAGNARPSSGAWDMGAYYLNGTPAPGFTVSPATIPAHHANNITLTLTGNGNTAWTSGTVFTLPVFTGLTKVGQTINVGAQTGTITVTTGAGTGTGNITDSTDAATAALTIATATLGIAPNSGNTSTTPTVTLTGTNTLWTTETAAGLFSESGGTGAGIGTPTVTSNTSATATLTTGSAAATLTITDTSTTATTAFTASASATAPTSVTTGTAGTITTTSAIVSGNSYTCTGSCATITSEGVCYATTANPTTPCTSNGTTSPWNATLSGLAVNTTYFARAFASNSVGTTYGSQISFTTLPNYQLAVTIVGDGGVTSSPSGITCPSLCSANYASGTAVTLTETPTAPNTFVSWSGGGCSGSATTCVVTMSIAQNVTATFTAVGGTLPTPTCTFSGVTTGSYTCTIAPQAVGCYTVTGINPTAPTPGICAAGSLTYTGAITITLPGTNLRILATEAGYTNSAIASYISPSVAAPAPQMLTETVKSGVVYLAWKPPSSIPPGIDITQYSVWRTVRPTFDGAYIIGAVHVPTTKFEDKGCTTTCYYAVKSDCPAPCKGSGYSNIVKAVVGK
jgi:hypothetical protein